MAAVFCIIDGLSDEAFSWQSFSYMGRLASKGTVGWLRTIPAGFFADSAVCILTLLGVPASTVAKVQRGWLEALGAGIPFQANDLLLRASWMALDQKGQLTGFAVPDCTLKMEEGISYFDLGTYKALLVMENGASALPQIYTKAPHAHLGQHWSTVLPEGQRQLCQLVLHSRSPQKILLPWGQSVSKQLPEFSDNACCICGVSTVRGIAQALQIPCPMVHGATGDTDTNLSMKAEAALHAAEQYPLVIIHVNGADEASHRHDPIEKQRFLHLLDEELAAPLMASGHSLLITSDHGSSPITGQHLNTLQPFLRYPALGPSGMIYAGGSAVKMLLQD